MAHPLETKLNAPAKDILDAIMYGFRAQVDVKGKLAELYLFRQLKQLERKGIIKDLSWIDKDGTPDFFLTHNSKGFKVECKNLRNETFRTPTPAYKVEIQRTRNSKDGTNTRSYRKDYFDILAICLFNQTKKWEFMFIKSSNLEVVETNPEFLKIMQRVPISIKEPWKIEILQVLSDDTPS